MSMTKQKSIIIGSIMILLSIIGAFLNIDSNWHYFGSGVFLGYGLSMIIRGLK